MITIISKQLKSIQWRDPTCQAILGLCLIALSNPMLAENPISTTKVGRYLFLNNKPLPQQRNLLSQTIEVHFPKEVVTVGDAIVFLLKPSGYTLESTDKNQDVIRKLFSFNLPLIDRNLGPMTLVDALKTLVGDSFILKIDRLNRQITFLINDATKKHKGKS